MSSRGDKPPKGTVRLTLEVETPIEAVVQRWTKQEAAALLAGDPEAREELVSQATDRTLWAGFHVAGYQIEFGGSK